MHRPAHPGEIIREAGEIIREDCIRPLGYLNRRSGRLGYFPTFAFKIARWAHRQFRGNGDQAGKGWMEHRGYLAANAGAVWFVASAAVRIRHNCQTICEFDPRRRGNHPSLAPRFLARFSAAHLLSLSSSLMFPRTSIPGSPADAAKDRSQRSRSPPEVCSAAR